MQQREQVHEQLAARTQEAAAEAAMRQQGLEADTGNLLDPAVIAQEQAAGQALEALAMPVKRRPPDDRRAIRLGAVSHAHSHAWSIPVPYLLVASISCGRTSVCLRPWVDDAAVAQPCPHQCRNAVCTIASLSIKCCNMYAHERLRVEAGWLLHCRNDYG